jgi:hypothetical protein
VRGLYAMGTDGRVDRLRPREQSERQPSARARNLEERTGQRSAERIAIEEAGTIIRQARTWRELHTALAAQGAIRGEGFRRSDLDRRAAGQGEHGRPRLFDGDSARPAG